MAFWLILQHSYQATGQIRKYSGKFMSNLIAEFKLNRSKHIKLKHIHSSWIKSMSIHHKSCWQKWWIPLLVTAIRQPIRRIRLLGGGGIGHQLEMPRGQQELCGHGGWGTGHPIPIPGNPPGWCMNHDATVMEIQRRSLACWWIWRFMWTCECYNVGFLDSAHEVWYVLVVFISCEGAS